MSIWNSEEDYDHLVKIVIIGDTAVGKTSLSSRYTKGIFNDQFKSTLGVDFYSKDNIYNNKKIKIQFWDTAGQEKYRALASTYYKNTLGAILVYDITNNSSFENIKIWYNELLENKDNKNIELLLVGNKIDLENEKREVKTDVAQNYAMENNMFFMETSAKSNINNCVNKAFDILIDKIVQIKEKEDVLKTKEELDILRKKTISLNKVKKNDLNKDEKKGCC